MEEKLLAELALIKAYILLSAKNVLNVDDVVILTGLSKQHIYKLTYAHKIPYYKPNGKLMYFNRNEIEAWMQQNRVTPLVEAQQSAIVHVVKGGIK